MKKSLLFWFAAVTCAAWILVGCESPTNGERGAAGANAPGTLPSGATPAMLAALFETTDTVIVGLPLGEGTFTVPAGKTLAVAGTVDITSENTVINAFDGTLDVSAGGFTADGGNVFIVAEAAAAAVKAAAPGGIVPAYAASIPSDPTEITGDVVLPSLTIGDSGTSGTNFATFAGTTYKVFVTGNLTIDATTTPFNTGSANLVVLGDTTAKGTFTAGATTKLGNLTASGALTLSGVSKADKLDTAAYTVTSIDTAVELDSLDSGADGKLSLTGSVTAVDIDGGNGNIQFPNATGTITGLSLENTGTIAFNHAAAALSIPGAVQAVFGGDVTLAGGINTGAADSTSKITFKGNVTLGDGKAITIAESTTASAVTLYAGKSIYAGTTKLVTAATNTAFTAAADGAVLTFTAATGLALSAQGVEFNGDVVFYGDLTLTAVPATFGGTAYFADTKKITMTTVASVITLNEGALLAHGDATKIPAVYSAILGGYTDGATLTPAANTTLTFGANGTKSITQAGTAGHGITIGDNAVLLPSATYTVASEAEKIGTLTVDTNATLIIIEGVLAGATGADNTAASAKLVLTGAATTNGALLTGAGSVVAGGTTIVGGDDGWQAVGTGTVTIAVDAITASAATAVLTAQHANSAITVAEGETLFIAANTAITVVTQGSIVLKKQTTGTNGAAINLSATTAKIDGLTGGTSNRTLLTSNIANATYTVGSATGNVTGGGSENAGGAYITGGNDTGPNLIKAVDSGGSDVTINASTKVGADV